MEFDPQDQDIIRLLTKLKGADGEYPENMLVARRRSFLKLMTEIELGIHSNKGGKKPTENTKTPSTSPFASKLLETALIVAIVAETSVMAYFYRDKLADFFHMITTASRVEEVTPPSMPTSLPIQEVSPSPAITATTIAASPTRITDTSTSRPIPDAANNTPGVNQLSATPHPNGNNGNHYGQTPKPERTKENNSNNDKPPKDKEDKPPKDNNDKPPKEESKPEKDK
ncbi:MAG: hypothetical protein EHM33_16980 [Chloroflexi bacterium]|nr:MAG: hypothetical protein EHM33_16980 [Chloroflexota bacterium]